MKGVYMQRSNGAPSINTSGIQSYISGIQYVVDTLRLPNTKG